MPSLKILLMWTIVPFVFSDPLLATSYMCSVTFVIFTQKEKKWNATWLNPTSSFSLQKPSIFTLFYSQRWGSLYFRGNTHTTEQSCYKIKKRGNLWNYFITPLLKVKLQKIPFTLQLGFRIFRYSRGVFDLWLFKMMKDR